MACPTTGSSEVFNNWNISMINNNPPGKTPFTISSTTKITDFLLYHYNRIDGNVGIGATPGQILLYDSGNNLLASWNAIGTEPTYNWCASGEIILGSGTYYVDSSNHAAWSYNSQSGNKGFTRVWGTQTIITATDMTLDKTTCPELCTVVATIEWTNQGSASGTFEPAIVVDGVRTGSGSNVTLTPGQTTIQSFSVPSLSLGDHSICPDPN